MIAVIRSEWIKVRSLRLTWGALVCSAVLMALMAWVVAASVAASAANGYDITMTATEVAADGLMLAQLPILMIVVLSVTTEHATGAYRTTLVATPRRGVVLIGKAAVGAGGGFVTGLALTAVGLAVAGPVLGPTGRFTSTELVRTLIGNAGYLALVAGLAVGVAAILRSTVVTLLAMLLLLLAVPTLLEFSSAEWVLTAYDYLPSTAGEAIRSGTLPYPPLVGAVVLACWTAVALLVGYAVAWWRDA